MKRTWLTCLTCVAFLALNSETLEAKSFFGVSKSSSNGQLLELEEWLAKEMHEALSNFLPKDAYYVRAKAVVAKGRPSKMAMDLGKATGFNSVVVHMPGSRRSMLERVDKVTFHIALNANVGAETRMSIEKMAQSLVPLNENGHGVFVVFFEMAPPALGLWGIWREIKWPLIALITSLLFAATFIRISGQELPHVGQFFKKIWGAWVHLVSSHRQWLSFNDYKVRKKKKSSSGVLPAGRFQSELYGHEVDTQLSDFISSLGVHDLTLLVKFEPELGAQVVSLLENKQRHKLILALDALTLRSLGQFIGQVNPSTIDVKSLKTKLNKLRTEKYIVQSSEVSKLALRNLPRDQECEFFKTLVTEGQLEKAMALASELVPIELAFTVSSNVLKSLFQDLEMITKVTFAYHLEKNESDNFYAQLVVPGGKLDHLLKEEIEAYTKSKTEPAIDYAVAELELANKCRDFIDANVHEKQKLLNAIEKWVIGLSGKGVRREVA